ncbi:hypothetical protein PoB_003592400 [Plakobranchus ocellatus]|uniref:Uncharacterized protein n=1 Tax=Plakobranchus ocellatus TaxID=259542 RepID=A0AAV4ATG6_9GAST|nr:hypothetical protein PoB_003592400 [Plakobranchus ocellatus]
MLKEKRRIREPCYNWKNGGEEEQRKTKRENARWHDFLDGDKESDGHIVGILGSRELEGHDRQRQGARHLMMMNVERNYEINQMAITGPDPRVSFDHPKAIF